MESGRLRGAGAVVVLLASVGTACGNGDDRSSRANGSRTATSDASENRQFEDLTHIDEPSPCVTDAGVTDTRIKVGVITVESGAEATSFAPALEGITARIDKANQTGELGARQITLVTRDDAGDVTRNDEVAHDLIEQEKVFGIIEDTSASSGSAMYLSEGGVPVAGWHAGVPAWSTYPNMFTFRQGIADHPDTEYTTRNAKLLDKLDVTKVALIGGDNPSGVSLITRIKKSVQQAGKSKVVYENVAVPPEQREFAAEAEAIHDSGADGVVTAMDLQQNVALNDSLAKTGATMHATIFSGGYDPRVLGLPGMNGAILGLEFSPFEEYKHAFQEFDKWAARSTVRGQAPFIGWLSTEMFIQGLKEAGSNCPTRKAFITNLRLNDSYDGGGAFDPVDLSEGFGEEFRCAYYVEVINGAFVPQFGGKAFCGDPITLR